MNRNPHRKVTKRNSKFSLILVFFIIYFHNNRPKKKLLAMQSDKAAGLFFDPTYRPGTS